jgi:aspartyl/asparaginyl-tRNA synthetase
MVSIFEKVFTVAHAYRAEPSVTTDISWYVGWMRNGIHQNWTEYGVLPNIVKQIFNAVESEHADTLKMSEQCSQVFWKNPCVN